MRCSRHFFLPKTFCRVCDPSRRIIAIRGNDPLDFIQGLYTNDVRLLKSQQRECDNNLFPFRGSRGSALYGAFLDPRGRVLYDSFLILLSSSLSTALLASTSGHQNSMRPNEEVILLDVHVRDVSAALQHLTEYRLRRKLDISEDERWTVGVATEVPCRDAHTAPPATSVGGDDDETQRATTDNGGFASFDDATESSDSSTLLVVRDPRAAVLRASAPLSSALRTYAWKTSNVPAELSQLCRPDKTRPSFSVDSELPENDPLLRDIVKKWVSEGFGEGPQLFAAPSAMTPLEANLDVQQWALSLHKGCYVGQELVMRAVSQGVIRKRVLPFEIVHRDGVQNSGGSWKASSVAFSETAGTAHADEFGAMKPSASTAQVFVSLKQSASAPTREDDQVAETINVESGEALMYRQAEGRALVKVGRVISVVGGAVGLASIKMDQCLSRGSSSVALQTVKGVSVVASIPRWWEDSVTENAFRA